MLSLGETGYLDSVQRILKTASSIKAGIELIPELEIIGNPLWVIAFKSKELDIYKIMDQMTHNGWNLNGLHKPSCVHICVTLIHTQEGITEKFIADLQAAVQFVKKNPLESGVMAPIYGMAASLPFRGVIKDILKKYLDLYYKV